ncbi:MAG TPA: UDP-glucose 4-epimerase GalE [Flavobacteriaceae bacterium]|nr:UDP-glucose 4-epimerase GalE [Flavobacteriaceae bacterium]|tara:strand:- start:339 stop:1361 length:1023 start_codon:yes stop_codon:yes gene_type:complete
MKVLITGGLGYIGSHVSAVLVGQGHSVVLLDDFSNSTDKNLTSLMELTGPSLLFYEINLCNKTALEDIFHKHPDLDGVIHFAAHKSVQESVELPLKYYHNNLMGLLHLLELILPKKTPLIFSSSCTVYGNADQVPIHEKSPLKQAISPYGATKQMSEQIIQDCGRAHPHFRAILLRYFNPIGAHPSGKIGESPQGIPQNLIPYLVGAVSQTHPPLEVFGDDYPTPDGTCIRDYIHIMDLATAHVHALQHLHSKQQEEAVEVYNVGTGKGHSVLDIIQTFEKVTDQKVPYTIGSRRPGDVVQAYAEVRKIETKLGWKATHSLEEALQSAWKWEQKTETPKP